MSELNVTKAKAHIKILNDFVSRIVLVREYYKEDELLNLCFKTVQSASHELATMLELKIEKGEINDG